jgi:enamine deaminase RidA (YjgF/YER057c/UK114 family)
LFSVTPRLPAGAPFVELAADMFARAQHALTDRGLSFGDVVRTWIYVADMGDYAALNQARNRFFKDSGIDRPPASTGIGGRLAAPPAAVAMDVYAVGGLGEARIETIHAERMGEAAAYGSAFARGVVLGEAGRRVAYLSGTASVDARGRVVAPRDLRGQLRRMFENARDLLAGVGLTPEQVLSATVYLKRPGFLREFRTAARYFGLPVDAPTAVVVAEVCRPAWLCEIELVAGTAGEAGSSRTL